MPEQKLIGGVPQSTTFGTAGAEGVIDQTWGALRASLRPYDFLGQPNIIGGHYSVGVTSGLTTGLAAGALLFSMMWSNQSKLLVPIRIAASALITTGFTTAQATDVDVIAANSWTTNDTGGTAVTFATGRGNKKRSNLMGPSAVTDMRVASASAVVAGATKTLDSNPFGISALPTGGNAGGAGSPLVDLYNIQNAGQHPEIFGQNEGFNIRLVTAQGAVGVVKFYFVIDWAEVPNI